MQKYCIVYSVNRSGRYMFVTAESEAEAVEEFERRIEWAEEDIELLMVNEFDGLIEEIMNGY